MTTAETVRRLLVDAAGDPLCDSCLAFACSVSLPEMCQVTEDLLSSVGFAQAEKCASCRRTVSAISYTAKCTHCSRSVLPGEDGLKIVTATSSTRRASGNSRRTRTSTLRANCARNHYGSSRTRGARCVGSAGVKAGRQAPAEALWLDAVLESGAAAARVNGQVRRSVRLAGRRDAIDASRARRRIDATPHAAPLPPGAGFVARQLSRSLPAVAPRNVRSPYAAAAEDSSPSRRRVQPSATSVNSSARSRHAPRP
jgi:hypothetical protein